MKMSVSELKRMSQMDAGLEEETDETSFLYDAEREIETEPGEVSPVGELTRQERMNGLRFGELRCIRYWSGWILL